MHHVYTHTHAHMHHVHTHTHARTDTRILIQACTLHAKTQAEDLVADKLG